MSKESVSYIQKITFSQFSLSEKSDVKIMGVFLRI
jgi:hypothetical protein